MQVTTQPIEHQTVVLQVELETERVNRAFEQAYRQIGRHVEVPGFRPGKAPVALLRQAVRDDYVRQWVLDELVKETLPEALKMAEVVPYGAAPQMDVQQLEEGKPMLYALKVPIKPKVELGEYRGLKVKRYKPVVTDEDITNEIEARRRGLARFERVEREAQPGDWLFVTMVPQIEGEDAPRATRRNLISLDESAGAPQLVEMLIGAKATETKEGVVDFPDNFTDEELRGKRVYMKVTVHGVSETKVPDDEELLDKMRVETMDALREQIREQIERELQTYALRATDLSMQQALLECCKVDISPIIIASRVEAELEMFQKQLQRRGYTLKDYIKSQNMTEGEFLDYLTARERRQLGYALVLESIAEQENITLAEEEREEVIQQLAQERGQTVEELLAQEGAAEEVEDAVLDRRINKVLQFLWDVAEITEEELRIQSQSQGADND